MEKFKVKQAIIISGGSIEESFALPFLKERMSEDPGLVLIAADRGLLFLKQHGIRPTHIVGDFDSGNVDWLDEYRQDPRIVIRKFRPEKDWTDTEIAAEQALELGCGRLTVLGGTTGTRVDHTMGNIQLLALILSRGGDGELLDAHNRIFMRDHDFTLSRKDQWGKYVSLFAYGGDVSGLTIRGMKYPVRNFTLGTLGTRGVSNEILEETARITFKSGKLLVIESRD